MIKFFRKIREDLLGKSKFSKYLIYAIGEIFLVVIGILLALQFNNWNIERENSKKERWYLINIVEDIEYQKGDLKELKENYEWCLKTAKSILADYQRLQSFSAIDSFNYKLNSLMLVDNFPNINNTYQELVSSGQQTLISNKDLSIDMIDYYLFCDDNYIDVKNNNDNIYYKDIHPIFSRLSQTILEGTDLSEEQQSLLEYDAKTDAFLRKELEKPENILLLLNALRTHILLNTSHLEMVEETLEIGKLLVQKIDNYLGLTPDMVNHYD
ncbi:DUF6090 family protein [Pseudotenacibaculum sp. MALMAid0570]|uniref:DUF6090 family protein n=1 Tax=Pseudotenacibaculum sp. MALMAid0570 TaxID=3143938 RepID=UPI0032DFFB23